MHLGMRKCPVGPHPRVPPVRVAWCRPMLRIAPRHTDEQLPFGQQIVAGIRSPHFRKPNTACLNGCAGRSPVCSSGSDLAPRNLGLRTVVVGLL